MGVRKNNRGDYDIKFTEATLQLVRDYRTKFPEVFTVLNSKTQGNRFMPEDFAPENVSQKKQNGSAQCFSFCWLFFCLDFFFGV